MIAKNLNQRAFFLLSAICLLNINGLFYMLFGVSQVGSPLLLICTILLLREPLKPKHCISIFGIFFFSALIFYLFAGSIYSVFENTSLAFTYLTTYGSTLLVIYAAANYVARQHERGARLHLLQIIGWISFAGTCSVFFSDFLFTIYKFPPLATERYSGVFANANEAGITSLVSFVFMLWLHSEEKRVKYNVAAIVSAVAVFFTLSKSCITALFLLMLINVFWRGNLRGAIFTFLLTAIAGSVLLNTSLWIDALTDSQAKRIEQSLQILSGEINSDTSTGRSDLWNYGISLAKENYLILGSGLGSFHQLEGGSLENGESLGVHHTYLMMLGEAGLPGALFFATANLVILYYLLKYKFKYLFMYFFILQIDFFAAHNVLGLRFHNVFIGIVFGYLAYAKNSFQRRHELE